MLHVVVRRQFQESLRFWIRPVDVHRFAPICGGIIAFRVLAFEKRLAPNTVRERSNASSIG